MKKVAILQSNYIPWKGYFDIIHAVDEFILYDDMQYTRRDWRNRNKIVTSHGLQWLTIPVQQYDFKQKIKDTPVISSIWQQKHWRSIQQAYAKSLFFKNYESIFQSLYEANQYTYLSEINYTFIKAICDVLGITTKISWSMEYTLAAGKTERLVKLVQDAGGTEYLSGPAAKDYLDESLFAAAGIAVRWMDYSGYPSYQQLGNQPFEHGVSVLDLLFNEGPNAPKFMKTFSTP
ncbi:WbqC family protein [Hymenobacter aerilatus]|uniref:WbqC family protein n=1 Tax=Hymenobacter aerilatus TaxID=2932251 RepID=A0A8T9SXP4_9BACT|nr:WbqC family protein [Hymenobacter aerilatus]UOR05704.1 WbqC family protein [Hymenobacter aerilatus]